ncbi:DNA-binding protein RHL1 [Iris pallida]|uniref:DNA-binding protein RHL1 n=1 Tax=Iris pallida TaxID=29817 RepID=A0AAX6HZU8_IRIPA|nr:DNA-binding protein RHL1 [Iris pallida]
MVHLGEPYLEISIITFHRTEASSPTASTFLAPVSEIVDIKKQEKSSSVKKLQGPSNKKGTLIQATVSTLFEKAEEVGLIIGPGNQIFCSLSLHHLHFLLLLRLMDVFLMLKSKRSVKDSGVSKASGARRKQLDSKKITDQVQVEVSKKKGGTSGGRKSGSRTLSVKKKKQVLDDDLEDISSDSQDDSDDDWSG